MSKIKVTYVAIDDEGAPIASARTQEHLKEALDIYYGVEKGAAKCEGWFPFQTEYPDDYEGYYEYSWCMVLRDLIDEGKDMVKVFCLNFHPHTIEENKNIPEISDKEIEEMLFHHSNEYGHGYKDGIKYVIDKIKNNVL